MDLATPDGAQEEPGEDEQILEEASAVAVYDASQVPRASELAVYNGQEVPGGGQQMPQQLTIGTQKAFKNKYAYAYEKRQMESETVYVCNKGSEWACPNEVLVLRYVGGIWIAYDSSLSPDGLPRQYRQPVFRCFATDITQPGPYKWEINHAASLTNVSSAENWHGDLWAETRVP